MLLDEKRTKRMVQIVAVLTAIAFVGVIFVVVGFIVFGGGGGPEADLRADAREQIEARPNDPDAWAQLAAAEFQAGNVDAALEAAQRAASLDTSDFSLAQTVVSFQLSSGDTDGAVETLRAFTQENPETSEGFFTLGQIADQSGQTDLARLSYQRYLQLAPDGDFAADVRERLEGIASGEPPPAAPAPADGAQGGG